MTRRLALRMALVLSATAGTGCAGRPSPHTEAPAGQALPAWLPGDHVTANYFPAGSIAIIKYIEKEWGPRLPSCWHDLVPRIEGQYMVGRAGEAKVPSVFRGALSREQVEGCAAQVTRALGFEVGFRRQGRLTEASSAGGRTEWLGWAPGGYVMWHHDRTRVEEFVEGRTGPPNPALGALIERVREKEHTWMASTMDMTGWSLGIPSLGFVSDADLRPNGPIPFRVVFRSEADARLAVKALEAKRVEAELPEALRRGLGRLAPQVTGSEVTLDAAPWFQDLEFMKATVAKLQEEQARRANLSGARR